MNKIKLTLTLLLLLVWHISFSNTVTIGPSVDCNFDVNNGATLQNAIDDMTVTEIRLAMGASYEPITINREMTLKGGYLNCAAAANGTFASSDSRSIIDGLNTLSAVTVDAGSTATVKFERLLIENGFAGNANSTSHRGGGINMNLNEAKVEIINSEIRSNQAVSGGGIFSGSTDLKIVETIIHNNLATSVTAATPCGGGLYARDGGNVLIIGNSGIYENNSTTQNSSAAAFGGGICSVRSEMQLIAGQSGGIYENEADDLGGGIWSRESTISLFGGRQAVNGEFYGLNYSSFQFSGNTSLASAGSFGGGIYADTSSDIFLREISMVGNAASNAGGGIYLFDSNLEIMDPATKTCWRDQGCNLFEENYSRLGGAIYSKASNVIIRNSQFIGNEAEWGSSYSSENGAAGTVDIKNSIFYKEATSNLTAWSPLRNVLAIYEDVDTNIEYSTFVDNETNTILGETNSNTVVSSSIFYNPLANVLFTSNGSTPTFDCVMVDIDNSVMSTISVSAMMYAGLFIDPANNNFRLQPNASAIDLCAPIISHMGTDQFDIQGVLRGEDDIFSTDVSGTYDAGANEFTDIIFKNGFELNF